jgi:hypothetical protein
MISGNEPAYARPPIRGTAGESGSHASYGMVQDTRSGAWRHAQRRQQRGGRGSDPRGRQHGPYQAGPGIQLAGSGIAGLFGPGAAAAFGVPAIGTYVEAPQEAPARLPVSLPPARPRWPAARTCWPAWMSCWPRTALRARWCCLVWAGSVRPAWLKRARGWYGGNPSVGSNPTSTATDLRRYVTLVAALCLSGTLLSQFWPRNSCCPRSRPCFRPQDRAVSCPSCSRRPRHPHGGIRRITPRHECSEGSHGARARRSH